MGKPQAPEPPDPVETSAASTGTNVSTALANAFLGNVSQYGPDGSSLKYKVTDHYSFTDPYTGEKYKIPMFSARTKLSPQERAIYNINQDTRLDLARTGMQQASFLKDYLSEPFSADPSEVSNYLYDLGADRLNPRIDSQRAALETKLANQGVQPGSAAWNAEIGTFNEGANDAYNSLLLNGYQQAWNNMMAERAQPINEITALMSGSQVALPNYNMNQPMPIPTTDNAKIITDIYNGELDAYGTQMSGYNSLMGGLFGLAGSIISDRRLKRDIVEIGAARGLPVYEFRYQWEPEGARRVGFMAQDVAQVYPQAVREIGGYLTINHDHIPETIQ